MTTSTDQPGIIELPCADPDSPIELVDGHDVRRKWTARWPLLAIEVLKQGMTQRQVTLAAHGGGTLLFDVFLEVVGEYVYARISGARWLDRAHRTNTFEIDRELAVRAEWLAIQMI